MRPNSNRTRVAWIVVLTLLASTFVVSPASAAAPVRTYDEYVALGDSYTAGPLIPRVLVGCPRLLPATGTCPELMPLADGDYRYATQIEHDLNAALRLAAARGRAEYVDTFVPSRGHDICSEEPWVNGQHTDPARAQRFHPFLAGMVGVADAVEAALRRRQAKTASGRASSPR